MKNKSTKYLQILLVIALIFIAGCDGKKNSENPDITGDVQALSKVFMEPDTYFKAATESFEKMDTDGCIKQISLAIKFLQSVVVEGDTIHADIIIWATEELTNLQQDISEGAIDEIQDVKNTFADADQAVGVYHMAIIEDWIKNEVNNKESLERIHRALTRVEYALGHKEIALSQEEISELNNTKVDVAKAETASMTLWEKVSNKIKELGDRMDYNSNSLDGDPVDIND